MEELASSPYTGKTQQKCREPSSGQSFSKSAIKGVASELAVSGWEGFLCGWVWMSSVSTVGGEEWGERVGNVIFSSWTPSPQSEKKMALEYHEPALQNSIELKTTKKKQKQIWKSLEFEKVGKQH